jgi:hypothetical protein
MKAEQFYALAGLIYLSPRTNEMLDSDEVECANYTGFSTQN